MIEEKNGGGGGYLLFRLDIEMNRYGNIRKGQRENSVIFCQRKLGLNSKLCVCVGINNIIFLVFSFCSSHSKLQRSQFSNCSHHPPAGPPFVRQCRLGVRRLLKGLGWKGESVCPLCVCVWVVFSVVKLCAKTLLACTLRS